LYKWQKEDMTMLRTLLRTKPKPSEISTLRSILRELTAAEWVYEDIDTTGPTGLRLHGTYFVTRIRDAAAVGETVAPVRRTVDTLKKHGLIADYYAAMGGTGGSGNRILAIPLQAMRQYAKSRKKASPDLVTPLAFANTEQQRGKFGDTVAMAPFDEPTTPIVDGSQLDARAALMPALQQLTKGTKINGHAATWQLGEGTHNEFWLLVSNTDAISGALNARHIAYEIIDLGAHKLVSVEHTPDLMHKLNAPLTTIQAPLLTQEQFRIDLPPDHSLQFQR
jgi:hypothetical protein